MPPSVSRHAVCVGFSATGRPRYTPAMPRLRTVLSSLLFAAVSLSVAACGSKLRSEKEKTDARTTPADDPLLSDPPARPTPPPPPVDDPDDPNKLVYLVSNQNGLYSFSPKTPGKAAYHLVGKLDCKAHGTPQSMAVDRNGSAWVFYDSRELFKVSILDATCKSTTYSHPSFSGLLGMGFTAVAPGSTQERLYIVSPDFGLATIDMPGLGVSKLGKLNSTSELTGGGDGKLFRFEASAGRLSEIDKSTYASHPIHTFSNMWNVAAFAFARYAGKFYVFTSNDLEPSKTTEWDPKTNTETVRDASIGFVVVGAGQSTLVPRGDGGGEIISGDFPEGQ